MNFDGESILFDVLGGATPSLPMCVRVVDLAHDTSIDRDISHSSIAGIANDVPHVPLTDLVEECIMVDFIYASVSPRMTLTNLSLRRIHSKNKECFERFLMSQWRSPCHPSLLQLFSHPQLLFQIQCYIFW